MAIVPILVEPTVPNLLALSAGLGLALAYTLKDYGSSFVAGLVTVMENTYQPGDWIECGQKNCLKKGRSPSTQLQQSLINFNKRLQLIQHEPLKNNKNP